MKKLFMQLPAPIQKVILFRLSGMILGCVILILAFTADSNWMLILPAILMIFYALISAIGLFLECKEGSFITLEGICSSLEQSAIRKRIQAIYLRSETHDIRILCRYGRLRDVRPGDSVTVYLREKTPVYEMEGCQVICDYIALQKSRTPGNKLAR